MLLEPRIDSVPVPVILHAKTPSCRLADGAFVDFVGPVAACRGSAVGKHLRCYQVRGSCTPHAQALAGAGSWAASCLCSSPQPLCMWQYP
jgi:hypothetical protein